MSSLLPPRWKDLESDERYSQLAPTQRLQVFNKWLTDASSYGTQNGWWEDEQTATNFKNLVKTKLPELSQAVYEENKIGGFEDVKDATARAGYGLAGAPRRLNQFATDTLLGVSRAIDYVPGLVADGLNKVFGTELKVDSWLTNQLRSISQTNQASIDALQEKSRALDGGELGELADQFATAGADAVVDVGAAMATGGVSIPGTLAKRSPGVFRGVLDDLVESFTGPSGRQMRIASTLGAGRSYSGTWNDAIREYTDMGFSREEAEAKATPEALNAGAATYLITMLGGKTGVESVLKNSGAQGLRGRLREVLTETASEGLEEGADQSLQDLNERFTRNPDKTVEDSFKEIKYAVGLGALLGGGFSAVGQTVEQLRASDAPETAKALETGWWETPEKTAQRVAQVKEEIDAKFGPDDERINEQIDELEAQDGDADPEPVTDTKPTATSTATEANQPAVDDSNLVTASPAPLALGAPTQPPPGATRSTEAPVNVLPTGTGVALPPQRMGAATLPDDLATAPVVDENADVFANVRRGQPPAVGASVPTAVTKKVYHDTDADFTDFDLSGSGYDFTGAFFRPETGVRQKFNTKFSKTAYVTYRNPISNDDAMAVRRRFTTGTKREQWQAATDELLRMGHDAIVRGDNEIVVIGSRDQISNTPPTATKPASFTKEVTTTQAPVISAPTSDAQAYEDSLVEEARRAGTKVTGRKAQQIKEEIKGKGWYPKQNVNKAVAEIRERVRQRLEAEPNTNTRAPASAVDPLVASLPEDATSLIAESRNSGSVPSSATINARYGTDGSVQPLSDDQRRAVRREAVRQVASDYGIAYDEDLDFTKDFDGNDNIPVRVTATGTEPVFVNNADVTARQLDQGLIPTVPEDQRGSVVEGIVFDAETGRVTAAVSSGVTVELPGELERAVRSTRPGSVSTKPLTSEKEEKQTAQQMRKFSKADQELYNQIVAQISQFRPSSPLIAERFSDADLVDKALSIWVNERSKDKVRAANKRKNYTAQQVWRFANEKALERVKNLPRQTSLDAPITETGTLTRGETVAAQSRIADSDEAKDAADREAANEADASIDEGVAADEPTNVSGPLRSTSSGMNYDQAYNIVNNPRMLQGAPKAAADALRAEAQELLDLAPQNIIDELENNDIDYWAWTAEDFRNIDNGNTGQVVSASPKEKTPYIAEQRSWMKSVARALGLRNIADFTPSQFTQLAEIYAERYRPYFDQGNTTLPESAVLESLPTIRAIFESSTGAASGYRAAIAELMAEYPGAVVDYSTGHFATAWFDPRHPRRIFFNPLLLEQELGGLTAAEARPFLKAVLFEEYIHLVERQVVPREFVKAIAQRLPDNVRQRVIDSYVGAVDQYSDPAQRQEIIDSLTDESVGSEYIRMMIQRMRTGQTTEDLSPELLPQNLFEQLMQMIRALVDRLRVRLEVSRDPVLAHTINAIEAQMRVLQIEHQFQNNPASVSREDLVYARRRGQPTVDIDDIDNTLPPGNGWLRPDGSWVAAETISAGDQVQGWEAEMGQFGGHEAAALEFLSMNDPNAYALLQDQLNSPDAFERGYEVVTDYMKKMGWLRVVQQDGDRIVFNGVANKAQEKALFTSAILEEKSLVADNGRRTETIYEPPTGGIVAARPRGRVDRSVISSIVDSYATQPRLSEAAQIARRGDRPIYPPEEGKFVSLQEGTQRYRHNLQVRRNQAAALTEWARSNGLLLDNAEFESRWQAQREKALREDPDLDPNEAANGVEHDVYFDEATQRWFKRAKSMTVTAPPMFISYDHYLDRLAAHAAIFPDTAPRLEGFLEYEFEEGGQLLRELVPVISQADVVAERGATRNETIKYMEARGFKMRRPNDKVNGHKDWVNNEGVIVEDLHDENIVVTPEGEIRVIDPVIYLPESFSIQAARPGLRIRGKRVGGKVERKPGGLLSSGAFTTKERDIMLKASQKIAKATANAEFLVNEFRRAVKKAYGKNPVPTDLINRALGSTDNRLTDQQVADLKKIRDKDAREVKRLQYMRDNRDQARVDRRDALAQLPAPVATALEAMGAKIDELSVAMMSEGYVSEDLIPVFEENLELYLHRSYAIFESPQWKDNMERAGEIADSIRQIKDPAERQKALSELPKTTREHVRVRVAFERFAVERAIAEYATEIRRKAKQNNQTLTRQQAIALAKADPETVSRKASDLVVNYLSVADQDAYRFFVQGRRIPGRRDLDIIKVRGQIPKEIREFWGEIKDADTNFTQTVGKMAAFMAHHDVATELLNHGISEGYVWKAGVSKNPNPPPGWVELIPKGTASPDSISPLYGARGPVELRDALVQMTQPQNTAGWARFFSFMTATTMAMKTIGYVPRSFIRNFLGNPLIVLGRGLYNLSDPLSMGKALTEGFRVARLNAGLGGNTAYQALRERALELGVIGDNVQGTLLKKLYEESTEGEKINELLKRSEFDSALEKIGVRTGQAIYKGASKLADVYQGVDDIWKMYAWEMEQQRQRAAHPTWNKAQIEEAAAQNIRNLVPTYSLSPELTQYIRRVPLFAPFITWTSEILRTSGNNIILGKQEIAEGYRTNNRAMIRNGASRLAGMLMATSTLPAFAAAMKAYFGYDDEDEEAVRTSLPEWQKNAQLIFLGEKDQGKVSYIDLSYLDPNQVFVEPIIAATRAFKKGDNPLMAWTGEFLRPLYSEQLFVGAVADLMRNRTVDGRPIYNEQDTTGNKIKAMVQHAARALGPGTLVTTIPNLARGFSGEVSPSGRVFNLSDEIYSQGFGQRIAETDLQTTLRQYAGRFMSGNAEATRLLNDKLLSRGTINIADIPEAYENANRAKRELFEDLRRNYLAAIRLGVPKNRAIAVLRDMGISKDLVSQVVNDRYVDYRPTQQTLENLLARPDGRERLRVLKQHLLKRREQDGD